MIFFSKVIAVILALLVITKTTYDYKKHREALATVLFWSLTWLGIVYAALVPGIFYQFIASLANKNIGMGTIFGIAFVFLFYVTYRVYVKANRLEQKIKDMVMKIGLKDFEK